MNTVGQFTRHAIRHYAMYAESCYKTERSHKYSDYARRCSDTLLERCRVAATIARTVHSVAHSPRLR
jgi:hypothetical protein